MGKAITVIQAGGQSRRMGRDKGLMPLAGRPLIEHVLQRVTGITSDVWITTNRHEYAYLDVPLAEDEAPGAGALFGLQTALRAVSADHILLVACDMPFLQRPLLSHLLSLRSRADLIVPHWGGYDQPLCAVYRRLHCLEAVERALSQGVRHMTGFYDQVRVHRVLPAEVARFDPEGISFFNVNTPDDLAAAQKIVEEQAG